MSIGRPPTPQSTPDSSAGVVGREELGIPLHNLLAVACCDGCPHPYGCADHGCLRDRPILSNIDALPPPEDRT